MVSVPVTDLGRALAFYAGTLGLKLARVDETMLGIRRVQAAAGGATCLSLVTWGESIPLDACADWSCGPATWPQALGLAERPAGRRDGTQGNRELPAEDDGQRASPRRAATASGQAARRRSAGEHDPIRLTRRKWHAQNPID